MKEQEKAARRLEREIEKQEALLADLEIQIQSAASDYQELTRLLGIKEREEETLLSLMEQWDSLSS